MKQIDKFDSQCNVSKKRKKRNIRQHGKIKEDKTTSRIFAGSFLLAIKIEFAHPPGCAIENLAREKNVGFVDL